MTRNRIRIAIAKGRIATEASDLIKESGFDLDEVFNSRKLRLQNKLGSYELILLKASDIPLYVQEGAVDVGIVGKDTVIESNHLVYELCELDMAYCTLCLAGPIEPVKLENGVKVATKYPRLAQQFLTDRGIKAEILSLSGSIEIAPLINLSDYIVDLVQTGDTLRENGLVVYDTFLKIRPLVIVNPISYRTKAVAVRNFIKICERYGVT